MVESMKQIVAPGNIKNGKLEMLDKGAFLRDIQITFDKDCVVDVIIERAGKKRSNQQNRYLWGIPYKLLSDHTGYTPDEMHGICKDKFLKRHFRVAEEEFYIGASTANLSTIEFEEYAENIRRWGATLGVNIPLPNENLEILTENLKLIKGELK
jgi:hypothetical protein